MQLLFVNGVFMEPDMYEIGEDGDPHIYNPIPVPSDVSLVDTDKGIVTMWGVEYTDEYLKTEVGSLCTRCRLGTQVKLAGKTVKNS